jgi:hypothetical protein
LDAADGALARHTVVAGIVQDVALARFVRGYRALGDALCGIACEDVARVVERSSTSEGDENESQHGEAADQEVQYEASGQHGLVEILESAPNRGEVFSVLLNRPTGRPLGGTFAPALAYLLIRSLSPAADRSDRARKSSLCPIEEALRHEHTPQLEGGRRLHHEPNAKRKGFCVERKVRLRADPILDPFRGTQAAFDTQRLDARSK